MGGLIPEPTAAQPTVAGPTVAGLTVRGLRKSFGRREVLDVDLHLDEGEVCVILGENGAGKTTLFRCLLGLDDHHGEVRIGGVRAGGRMLGILDRPMLYPRWSAAANLRYLLNDSDADGRELVRELVGPELLRQRVGRMSTGQTKLVLLAALLASDADVLLLDEFANGLDQTTRARFREVVSHEVDARRRIVIATGHDLSAFGSLPTRVLLLHDRTLHDITADYLTDKDLARAYAKHRSRNQT